MVTTEILTNIRKIVRSINLESKRILKEYGVSIPQLLTLNHLYSCEGHQATHKELTDILVLNSSTVTGIINRLEKKGFLARLPKKNDRRTTYVILTSAGEKLIRKTPTLLHEKLAKKLQKLSNHQLDELQNSLLMLVTSMDIGDIEASPILTIEDPLDPEI